MIGISELLYDFEKVGKRFFDENEEGQLNHYGIMKRSGMKRDGSAWGGT